LSKLGIGPRIFYACKRFRLEEFFESEVLLGKNMMEPHYMDKVAMALSDFHKLKYEHIPISQDHLIKRTFFNRKEEMLEICRGKLNQNIYTPEDQPIVEEFKKWVTAQEIEEVEAIMKKY